jgi:hypothetical protein
MSAPLWATHGPGYLHLPLRFTVVKEVHFGSTSYNLQVPTAFENIEHSIRQCSLHFSMKLLGGNSYLYKAFTRNHRLITVNQTPMHK